MPLTVDAKEIFLQWKVILAKDATEKELASDVSGILWKVAYDYLTRNAL
jgi:hypothetical protein